MPTKTVKPAKTAAPKHAYAKTLKTFRTASGKEGQFYSLPALARTYPGVSRMPVSMRIVLESVLRNCDGQKVTPEHVARLAQWGATAERTEEIPFVVARVVLQDFTGVPCVVDLAAMRDAVVKLGGDAKQINPLAPAELVIDHSVQVDV
ncbi:MAG: aconitate hydratase, partial [Burkholderiales bacterium]|nr:aconitate hydratase [Burkholderiales bacterium]